MNDDRLDQLADVIEVELAERRRVDDQDPGRRVREQLVQQVAAMLWVERNLDGTDERSTEPRVNAVGLIDQHRRDRDPRPRPRLPRTRSPTA